MQIKATRVGFASLYLVNRGIRMQFVGEAQMTTRKRKEPKRRLKTRQVQAGVRKMAQAAGAVVAVEEAEKPFDEPASPAPSPVVPVEEPTARPKRGEEVDICSSPAEAQPDASDLH